MVKVILFDVDGTLIHTHGAGVEAFARAFHSLFNFPDTTKKISFAGRTDISLVKEYFRLNNYTPSQRDIEDFFPCYISWLGRLIRQSDGAICPGVKEFIAAAHKLPSNPLIGLLTGNIRLGAEIKLKHFGLWDEFKVGAFADDSEDRDQIARIAFKRANQMLNNKLQGNEVVVVGDTPYDIKCARAIGARALAVSTGGYSRKELAIHKPDWLVNTLLEISPEQLNY